MLSNCQALVIATELLFSSPSTQVSLEEKICGQELILYPIRLCVSLGLPTTVFGASTHEPLQKLIDTQQLAAVFAPHQEAHTPSAALANLQTLLHTDQVLIIHGAIPLLTSTLIEQLYEQHIQQQATISFIVAHHEDASLLYERVVQQGKDINLIAATSCTDTTIACCVAAGVYLIKRTFLEKYIHHYTHDTPALTLAKLVTFAQAHQHTVTTVTAPFDTIRSVTTFNDVWVVEQIKRAELIRFWMEHGVRFTAPHTTHLDLGVTIGAGTTIGSGVQLLGNTKVGAHCTIELCCLLDNAHIGHNSTIHAHSVIKDSRIGTHVSVGPYAHVHEQSAIGAYSTVGNFVEVKRSLLGEKTKAKHLAYLGDATIGNQVNIGAGSITCNHDGIKKHPTTIHDYAYIGSNTTLIAPVSIGTSAFTAAGSTITHDVPAQALALGRARQVIKEGYALKLLKQLPPIPKAPTTQVSSSVDQTPKAVFSGALKLDPKKHPLDFSS